MRDPTYGRHAGHGEPASVLDAALGILARPAVWVGFAIAFALLLALLLALAAGEGAAGARFDYDLF